LFAVIGELFKLILVVLNKSLPPPPRPSPLKGEGEYLCPNPNQEGGGFYQMTGFSPSSPSRGRGDAFAPNPNQGGGRILPQPQSRGREDFSPIPQGGGRILPPTPIKGEGGFFPNPSRWREDFSPNPNFPSQEEGSFYRMKGFSPSPLVGEGRGEGEVIHSPGLKKWITVGGTFS